MISEVVKSSNRKNGREKRSYDDTEREMACNIKKNNEEEMRAFMGKFYARRPLNKNHYNILYKNSIGHLIFSDTMPGARFGFLHSHISFNDSNTGEGRFLHDKFVTIRELFEEQVSFSF